MSERRFWLEAPLRVSGPEAEALTEMLPTPSLRVMTLTGTLSFSPVLRVRGRVIWAISGLLTVTSLSVLPCALPSVAMTIALSLPMY